MGWFSLDVSEYSKLSVGRPEVALLLNSLGLAIEESMGDDERSLGGSGEGSGGGSGDECGFKCME